MKPKPTMATNELANEIVRKYREKGRVLVIVEGPEGCGKTTLRQQIANTLSSEHGIDLEKQQVFFGVDKLMPSPSKTKPMTSMSSGINFVEHFSENEVKNRFKQEGYFIVTVLTKGQYRWRYDSGVSSFPDSKVIEE